jgi:site-specific DNA recombinase
VSLLTTTTTAAYEYRTGSELPLYALKRQKSPETVRSFRAKSTYGHCIKDKVLIENEKYIGDALLQKTYTVDVLTKKRVKNNGIVPQYYVENSHEPIIPRELFMQVQEEMVRRANLRGGKDGKKRVYSSKYALSSIVYCGQCGDIYRRVHWNNRGYKSIVWRCVSRLEEKGSECTAPTINEETLQTAVVKAINELLANKEPFLQALQKNIATILNEENDNAK